MLGELGRIIDPDFGTDIVSCGFIKELQVDGATGRVEFKLELTTPACPVKDSVRAGVYLAIEVLKEGATRESAECFMCGAASLCQNRVNASCLP